MEAICKADSPEPVFDHLPLSTTDICFEELKRNKSTSNDYHRVQAIEQVLELWREFGSPEIIPTGMEYKSYIDDQGEDSIIQAIGSSSDSQVEYILLFDSSGADQIEEVVDTNQVEVNTPGRAFELLWQGEFITKSEHYQALRRIAEREGWRGEALVERLPHTKYEDVF